MSEILDERKKRNVSIVGLSKITGIPVNRIYKWESGKANPKTEDAEKLKKWLNNPENVPQETFQLNDTPSPSYLQQRFAQKNNAQEKYTAPFFPIKAQAGYVRTRDQEMFIDSLERYALPPGLDPHGAIWRYWEVEGRSMEPVFQSGDIILTSQVHHMDWENLRNFYVYVIVTADVVLIKRIYCKNALEWVLISENEAEFEQQILSVEFIKEVWIFRRKIETKAPPTKRFEIKV